MTSPDGTAAEAAVETLKPRPLRDAPELGALRPIKPLNLVHIEPGLAEGGGAAPTLIHVDPRELLVDETYQRQLSERSLELIRRIVARWDWRRFKPPIVAVTEAGMMVVDGQHTAIAAATHPAIATIPVLVIEAESREDQARAFVGHNRDRVGITALQIHFAALAAGDEDAQTIDQVCQRAGVTLVRVQPSNGLWKPRESMAIQAIAGLINRRGAQKARIVLQVLAEANCAPITASQIKAIEHLLTAEEYREEVTPEALTTALLDVGCEWLEQEGKIFAAAHKAPQWRAQAVVLFKRARRGRRRAA